MATFFDYLDAYLVAYHDGDAVADPVDVPDAVAAEDVVVVDDEGLLVALSEVEVLFGALDDAGSPADAWLSGNEFSGEAEIGGTSFTSGTVDTSGQGNDVYAVDGEVLDLPG